MSDEVREATKQCRSCGEGMVEWAERCPHCRAVQRGSRLANHHFMVGMLIVAVLVGALMWWGNTQMRHDEKKAADHYTRCLNAREAGIYDPSC